MQQLITFFTRGKKYFGDRLGGGYQIFRDHFQIPSNPHSTYFMTSPLRSGHNRCI